MPALPFDVERMRALRDTVTHAETVQGALEAFHEVVTRPTGAVGLAVVIPTPDGFRLEASVGVESHLESDPRRLSQVLETHRDSFIEDLRLNPRWTAPASVRSALLIPLMSHDVALGVLGVCWPFVPDHAPRYLAEAAAPLLAGQIAEITDFGLDQNRVLLVEDDPRLVDLVDLALSTKGLAVTVTRSLAQAREAAARVGPDVVVADMRLSDGTGTELAKQLKRDGHPRFLYLSGLDVAEIPLEESDGYMQKPFHPRDLVYMVDLMLRGQHVDPHRSHGEDLLEHYALELAFANVWERAARAKLEDSYLQTVQLLATAVEARDKTTGAHLRRVRTLGCALAEVVEPDLLRDHSIEFGFFLHDIGKIGIPDSVLLKPGRLTEEEMEIMKRHVTIGEQIVTGVPYLETAQRLIAAHHERWDGKGYTRGLKGEAIPLPARIFSVCDTFDAMTCDRPYRKGMDPLAARDEIGKHAGTQFDPSIVEAFLGLDVTNLDES